MTSRRTLGTFHYVYSREQSQRERECNGWKEPGGLGPAEERRGPALDPAHG